MKDRYIQRTKSLNDFKKASSNKKKKEAFDEDEKEERQHAF